MQYREYITPKGVRTMLVKSPGSTAASIQVWFRAGSALESESNQGIAHFLEHMFFKGTKKRPGSKIADEVETFGGEINAFTSFDYTCYFINCPKNKIQKSTEILMDMVSEPLFSASDIGPEREVVQEELKRSIDNPSQYSFSKIQSESFGGAYSRSILGKKETIAKFSRPQLERFKNQHYSKSNMLVVVAGDFDDSTIIKKIDSFDFPVGKDALLPEFSIKAPGGVNVHCKETNMCQLTICCQGTDYLSEFASAEDLAINCLGHGETSPLYEKLVMDDTLANYASSTTMYMAKGSAHLIRINFPEESLKEVYKKLVSVLSDSIENGFSEREITKIQNQYIASKIYEKETLEAFSFTLGNSYAQTGDYLCEQKFIDKLNDTKPESVNSGLQRIFNRDLHFSLQVPQNMDMKKAKAETVKLQREMKALKKKGKTEKKISSTSSKFDPQVKKVQLKEGISLIYRNNNITPTFAMHIYTKGGLTEENAENNGAHNLISSLITRGHREAGNEEIQQYLEDNSASLQGFSGKNAYGMTLNGMSKNSTKLFNHFFNSFFHPTFPAKYLKHEKELSFRALKMQEEDPVKHCFESFSNMVFKGHPYAQSILGTKKSIKSQTRKTLHDLHLDNVNKREIQITYCGDLSLSEVMKLLAPFVNNLNPRKKSTLKRKSYTPISGNSEWIEFPREQAHILIGIPTSPLGSKDNIYLKMLTAHLIGQSSELFVEVRDRLGLCYSAQPVNFMAMEGGYWAIYIATGNDKVDKATEAVEKLIHRIANKGITKREFKKIKSMIRGQEEINIQTNEDYANVYSVPSLQGLGLDYFHKNSEIIEAVQYEDFQKNVRRLLSKKFNKVIVGQSK